MFNSTALDFLNCGEEEEKDQIFHKSNPMDRTKVLDYALASEGVIFPLKDAVLSSDIYFRGSIAAVLIGLSKGERPDLRKNQHNIAIVTRIWAGLINFSCANEDKQLVRMDKLFWKSLYFLCRPILNDKVRDITRTFLAELDPQKHKRVLWFFTDRLTNILPYAEGGLTPVSDLPVEHVISLMDHNTKVGRYDLAEWLIPQNKDGMHANIERSQRLFSFAFHHKKIEAIDIDYLIELCNKPGTVHAAMRFMFCLCIVDCSRVSQHAKAIKTEKVVLDFDWFSPTYPLHNRINYVENQGVMGFTVETSEQEIEPIC